MGNEQQVVALARVENENVGVLMRRSTDVAGVCREIVLKTAQTIGNRKYVRVEGWQSIAVAYGCVASARDVEVVEGGIRAIGEVRRMSDGSVLATAEGFVGTDEPTWAARPMYARRAMAQTRAVSRACRSAFAFIVTLIDGDLSTTPAEEMDGISDAKPVAAPAGVEKLRAMAVAPPAKASPARPRLSDMVRDGPPPHTDADFRAETPAPAGAPAATHDRAMSFAFGRAKGVSLGQLADDDLSFYRSACRRTLDDPAKANFHQKETLKLAAVEAELRFRGLPV